MSEQTQNSPPPQSQGNSQEHKDIQKMMYDINIHATQFAVFKADGKSRDHIENVFNYQDKGGFTSGHGLPKIVDDAIRSLNMLYEAKLVFTGRANLKTARQMPVTLVKNNDDYFILCYRNYDGAFPEFNDAHKLSPDELAQFNRHVMAAPATRFLSLSHARECPVPEDFDARMHETSSVRTIGRRPAMH